VGVGVIVGVDVSVGVNLGVGELVAVITIGSSVGCAGYVG